MPSPPFAHLAAVTAYSLRHGVMRPGELAAAVAERGMEAVGVCDRDGLLGAVRLAQACAAAGVKPIFGTDLALATAHGPRAGQGHGAMPSAGGAEGSPLGEWAVPSGAGTSAVAGARSPRFGAPWLEDDAPRVRLIAHTQGGYARLCRLVSDAHLDAPHARPRLTWQHLADRLGDTGDHGLWVLVGGDDPVGRRLDAGRLDAARDELRAWMELAGRDNVRVAVTHHRAPAIRHRGGRAGLADDDERARRRFALADELGVTAIADQRPRYRDPGDARLADAMDAIRGQVPLEPRHVRRRNTEGYLKTPAQMAAVFAERPDAIANAAADAHRCDVDLGLGRRRVPDYAGIGPNEADAELARRCEAGLHERYAAVTAAHRQRLDHELALVAQLGLAPYFLTVAEVTARIRGRGITVACRGSAAGSLLAYCLRICDVDPIRHDLVVERFMNPYRDELPDIDLDVESARREDVEADLIAAYGDERVTGLAMVETFRARGAIREVGKALGLPAGEVDAIATAMPHIDAGDVRTALAQLPELAGMRLDRPDTRRLLALVERLGGLPRHTALHPSGVVLGPGGPGGCRSAGGGAGLRDLVACQRSAHGLAMAQIDKRDVEALGLCKLDVLGVRMLSTMRHALDEVARVRGVALQPDDVPVDDPAAYQLIRTTRTLGLFQIESPGQRELLGKLQPRALEDLVIDISLFRPGPVKGDMVRPFLRRHHGGEDPPGRHPLLEAALAETHGVIVYHEQVMRCVAAATGCDLSEADRVRRQLADPDETDRLHAEIVAGARRRGMSAGEAEALWQALAQFASFGFCKAHAAAFAVPTARSAWLKAHYLPELVAGLLTHDPGMYPRRLLLADARQFGVCVLGVDVNASEAACRVERVATETAWAHLGVDPATGRAPRGWRRAGGDDGGGPEAGGAGRAARGAGAAQRGRGAKDGAGIGLGAWMPPAGIDAGTDPGDPTQRFGIRLGLADVAGVDEAMIDSLVQGRPYASIADVARRVQLDAPVAEALAHVGAFDSLAAPGQSRRDVLLETCERWGTAGGTGGASRAPRPGGARRGSATTGKAGAATAVQPALLDPPPSPGLAGYRPSEQVRAELEVLGLDASRHVVSFYDDLLDALGATRAVDLLATSGVGAVGGGEQRPGRRLRVAGVKVATQTPAVPSGQRVIFLSLDDATGVVDATFFESTHERCAATVFHAWLLAVEGRVQRAGARGVSLTADRAWDLVELRRAWRAGRLEQALEPAAPSDHPLQSWQATANADRAPGKLWHASPGSAGR